MLILSILALWLGDYTFLFTTQYSLIEGGCIKIKHLVHPLVFYVAENAIYVKQSKISYFSKIFDSQGAKSEIKAKTDRFGAYFPHFESVWLLLNTFSLS